MTRVAWIVIVLRLLLLLTGINRYLRAGLQTEIIMEEETTTTTTTTTTKIAKTVCTHFSTLFKNTYFFLSHIFVGRNERPFVNTNRRNENNNNDNPPPPFNMDISNRRENRITEDASSVIVTLNTDSLLQQNDDK
jgi:hypothetical protein